MPNRPGGDDPSEPLENRQSKIANRKRRYVKTPARLAAARANLEKARAVPKEKVYRRTEKRLAANRANLAKAKVAGQQELENIVDRLDLAFPPLFQEMPAELAGACPCGSGKISYTCCKTPAPPPTSEPELSSPTPLSSDPEDDGAYVPRVKQRYWVLGWPDDQEGVDREAADYGALEKAGRALLRRRRALLREVRREGREVMRLLTQAAARTVAPTLQDILALASGLMAVLWSSRPLDRAKRLNQQVGRLLQAFVEKRYERAGGVGLTPEAEVLRVLAQDPQGLPPLRQRKKRARRVAHAGAKPERRPKRAHREPSDPGPDLPENPREFGLLVRRAFCAPHPEPEDKAVAYLIDTLSERLWDRLHSLERGLKHETETLHQLLDQLGKERPRANRQAMQERFWWIEAELKEAIHQARPVMKFCGRNFAQQVQILVLRRYGSDPEIERFGRAWEEQRVRFERQADE